MTEKRYYVKGKWITDSYTDKLLNIDFNTINDAMLCCGLLNDTENKYMEMADMFEKSIDENKELKTKNFAYQQDIEVFKEENTSLKLYKNAVQDVLLSWSQKDLTAKQLQVVIGIMEELNVKSDFKK